MYRRTRVAGASTVRGRAPHFAHVRHHALTYFKVLSSGRRFLLSSSSVLLGRVRDVTPVDENDSRAIRWKCDGRLDVAGTDTPRARAVVDPSFGTGGVGWGVADVPGSASSFGMCASGRTRRT